MTMSIEPVMDSTNNDNDSDSVGTLTSSDCSDDDDNQSDDNLSEREDDSDVDGCETESYRSLAFSVQSGRSTATVKSKKTKKWVQFKPGDSLVLVYIIPNREMLGLKSESEDSDDSDDDCDDSDDEDEDDDSDEESEDEDEDEEDNDEDEENKNKKKQKPFAKLMAVKQVTKHKKPERKVLKPREKNSRLISLNINHLTQKPPRKNNRTNRRRERKERVRNTIKDNNIPDNKTKQGKSRRNISKVNVISVDMDKNKRSRRNKAGILEIKATVQGDSKQETTASVPKLMYKNDFKPSVVNVNGALTVCQTKLLQRSKLQPMALRVSKMDNRPKSCPSLRSEPQNQRNVRHVVSTGYDSLTSLLPDTYNGFRHSLSAAETLRNLDKEGHSPRDFIKRLNPDSMNDSSKRHYAWQVANGNISSQSLRTPSILPFWDSLKGSVPESNSVKLPL